MRTNMRIVGTVFAIAISAASAVLSAAGSAQSQAPARPPELPAVPVRVDVVLTRYQGDKKTSSLPFSLYTNAGSSVQGQVSMRMGIDVPVGTVTSTNSRTQPLNSNATASNTTGTTSTKTEYRSVGTNIDVMVGRSSETQFTVGVNVNDSSIYSADGDTKSLKSADVAAFRTFNMGNTIILRDGQTAPLGTGTDKVSGELLKIEVTLTVVK